MKIIGTLDYKKIAKFIVSGGLAAIIEYTSFILFSVIFGLAVVPSNILSFIIGLTISFSLNKTWVFTSKGNGRRQLLYYSILAIINLILSSGVIWLLVNELSTPGYIAKIFVMIMIATWNYCIFSKVIFKVVANLDDGRL